MKQRRVSVLSVAVLVCAFGSWWPGLAGQAGTDQRIARIEGRLLPGIVVKGRPEGGRTIAERMRFHHTPGVSVAVLNDGAIEWARGYGVLEAGAPGRVTSRTRFQAASISKPVAAMAALRLVQGGRLSLDEDINVRLTSWKVPDNDFTRTEKVTLRRILSHSAGLTVHGFPGYRSTAALPSLAQVLEGVKPANTAPIRVDVLPGSAWRYSGGGYTVLQQALVDVAGRAFPELMRDTVLRPLRMDDSTYEQPLPAALRAGAASAHDVDGKPIPGGFHTYPEMAAAGLWTTPTDLAKFAIGVRQALAGQSGLLSAATAKEMLSLQKGSYGLGLALNGSGGEARFGHGGSNAGYQCQLVAYAGTGQGAVVMTNGDAGGRLGAEILRTIASEYGWPGYPGPREKAVASIDPSVLQAYAGRYEMRPGRVITLTASGGTLFLTDGAQKMELLPESATRFFELTEESEVEFLKGPDGTVSGALINGRIKARRLDLP
ncbi:MAG TPA: serine hydrolase [Vicinamibacterales bacterium]|nr:serine hydrolase [Vicinamibacterales bacterium]